MHQWLEPCIPRYGIFITAMKNGDGALRRVNFSSWEGILSGKKTRLQSNRVRATPTRQHRRD